MWTSLIFGGDAKNPVGTIQINDEIAHWFCEGFDFNITPVIDGNTGRILAVNLRPTKMGTVDDSKKNEQPAHGTSSIQKEDPILGYG